MIGKTKNKNKKGDAWNVRQKKDNNKVERGIQKKPQKINFKTNLSVWFVLIM